MQKKSPAYRLAGASARGALRDIADAASNLLKGPEWSRATFPLAA